MTDKEKKQHENLAQLVHDLDTKKNLCHVKDYPEVKLKKLNHYVKKFSPLVDPIFGEQPAFFIDEGRFIPGRMIVDGLLEVATEIAVELYSWSTWSRRGGRVATTQGVHFRH